MGITIHAADIIASNIMAKPYTKVSTNPMSQMSPSIKRTPAHIQNKPGDIAMNRNTTECTSIAFHFQRYSEYANPMKGYKMKVKGTNAILKRPKAIARAITKVPSADIVKL